LEKLTDRSAEYVRHVKGPLVTVLAKVTLREKTGAPVEVGTVEFYRLPAKKAADYKCMPRRVLTLEQARVLSTQVPIIAIGEIGDFEWQLE